MFFCRDQSRRHRDRGYYPGYPPYGYYDDSEAYESYERYSYAMRKRKRPACARRSCLCNGDFREPYETLSCYDPFEGYMKLVHDCYIAMQSGRFIAQDAAERIEDASKMINRAFGYDPIYKQYSGFLEQMARDVQMVPHQAHHWPRQRHSNRPGSLWFS